MFLNSMPRLDALSDDALATLDAGWERLAAEVGVRFDHPRALELFQAAGQTVDGDGRALRPGLPARAGCARAGELLTARAQPRAQPRGRRRPHDLRARQRPAVRAGRRRAPRRHDGRPRAAPEAHADDRRARHARPQHRSSPTTCRWTCATCCGRWPAIRLTDRVWSGEPSSDSARPRTACAWPRSSMGGAEAMRERPAVFCNVNVNSPLHFDVRMLEGLLTYADAGQAVIVTPFLLMGAMAPVVRPGRARPADGRGAGRDRAGAAGPARARPA